MALATASLMATAHGAPYCNRCHEMKPYVQGWSGGLHSGVQCNQCHTDRGLRGLVSIPVRDLRDILVHFLGRVDMTRVRAQVPGRRCTNCHDMTDRGRYGERLADYHQNHLQRNQDCAACHATVGHTREKAGDGGRANCGPCHLASAREKLAEYGKD